VDEVHHHLEKLAPLDGGGLELGNPINLPHAHKLETLSKNPMVNNLVSPHI